MQANDSPPSRRSLVGISRASSRLARVAAPGADQRRSPRDNGEGLVGETDDSIVTFFSLGVVIFFAVFVIARLDRSRAALERRKDERKAAELRKRVGW